MGHTAGSFLGGVARGQAQREQELLNRSQLEQQASQFDITAGFREQELGNAQTEEIRNRINETRINIQELAKNTTDKNNKFVQQQLAQLTKTLATDMGTLNAIGGGTTDQDFADAAQQSAVNLFQSTPSIIDIQDVEREGKLKDISAGAIADPTKIGVSEPNIVKQQRARDLAIAEGRDEDAAEIQAQIDASETFDPRSLLSGIDEEAIAGAVTVLNESSSSLALLEETARLFKETPEAGGVAGAVITNVGGIVEQIPLIGKALLDTAGINTTEVTKARTTARINVARMLSTITGEESGRFTESERKIAERTLATLDAKAGPSQIAAALEAVGSVLRSERQRSIEKLLTASKADLSTDEGINEFGKILVQNGVNTQDAVRIIQQLVNQQR